MPQMNIKSVLKWSGIKSVKVKDGVHDREKCEHSDE